MSPVLLDLCLKTTLIFSAAWVITVLLLRRASAASRHLVWTAAACGVLLLPLCATFLPAWEVPVPAGRWTSIVFQTHATGLSRAAASAAPLPASASLLPPPPPDPLNLPPAGTIGGLLIPIWAAGVALGLLRLLVGHAKAHRCAAAARAVPEIDRLAREWTSENGIRRPARILVAPRAGMPITFGLLRPVILLPAEALSWPRERLRMVLSHEWGHILRHDCLTQWIMRIAASLYWFHPLAWVANHRFLRERERACDDLVLLGGAPASVYAQQLLEVARSLPSAGAVAFATLAMARPSELEGRLVAILDAATPRRNVSRQALAAAAMLVLACVLPLAVLRAAQQASSHSEAVLSDAQVRAAAGRGDYAALEKTADVRNRRREFDEAEQLYLKALALREARFGPRSPEYADGLVKLAKFYPSASPRTTGRAGDPVSYWRRALAVREGALGPEHPDLAEPLYQLALAAHRKYSEAQPLYERALAIRTKAFGAGSPELAPILTNLALLEEQQGNSPAADLMYTRAQNTAESGSPQRATALELHARLLRGMGQETEARLAESEASQIRIRRFAETTAPQSAGEALRAGRNGVASPALLSKVEPEYSDEARAAKYQGKAVLSIEIGLDGKAANLRLVHSLGLGLDEKAAEAIRQWVFRPGSKDGRPVVVAATVEVNFRLL